MEGSNNMHIRSHYKKKHILNKKLLDALKLVYYVFNKILMQDQQ